MAEGDDPLGVGLGPSVNTAASATTSPPAASTTDRIPSSVLPVEITSSTSTTRLPATSARSFSSRCSVCGCPVVIETVSALIVSPMYALYCLRSTTHGLSSWRASS